METFNPSTLRAKAYPVITQNGSGSEMDRYIYAQNQNGEGLSSFFGSIMKNAVPFLGKVIKGGWNVSKPHLAAAGKELITAGAKKGVEALTKKVVETGTKRSRATKVVHRPHKRRKRAQWQSL